MQARFVGMASPTLPAIPDPPDSPLTRPLSLSVPISLSDTVIMSDGVFRTVAFAAGAALGITAGVLLASKRASPAQAGHAASASAFPVAPDLPLDRPELKNAPSALKARVAVDSEVTTKQAALYARVRRENEPPFPETLGDVFDRQRCVVGFNQPLVEQQVVLCLGTGGIGCSVALACVRMGVKKIFLIDYDVVEASNLNRQVLFCPADVGSPKVEAAKRGLERCHNLRTEIVALVSSLPHPPSPRPRPRPLPLSSPPLSHISPPSPHPPSTHAQNVDAVKRFGVIVGLARQSTVIFNNIDFGYA